VSALFEINKYDITASAGPNGTISPLGTVWVPHGGSTNFLITPNANYQITNLVVDGVPVSVTNMYVFSNVTGGGRTIAAYFGLKTFTLTVVSPYGAANPAGTTTNYWNTPITASVAGSPVVAGTTQYVCTGWIGTGSVPAAGTGTNTTFSILTNSTVRWQWRTNFWLSAMAGEGGTVNVADGWQPAGSNMTVIATASAGYHFVEWSGDTNGCTISGSRITAPMTTPRNLMASFAVDVGSLRVFISPAQAVAAGARWMLVGDEVWRTNGATIAGLLGTEQYAVTFNSILGWTSPEDVQSVTITNGGVATISAIYVQGDAVLVRGGTFQMGVDTNGNGGHSVTLDDFWLDRRTVTVAEFRQFCTNTGRAMPPQPWTNDALPVVNVAWQDASDYASYVGKRLPTEAEYEYAMRGGQPHTVRYPFGSAINSGRANYNFNVGRPTVAGTYPSTGEALGVNIDDIAGNVWSWCNDWYQEVLPGPVANPAGALSGTLRVIRGGSWASSEMPLRCHTRYELEPTARHTDLGFRCAKTAASGSTPPADTDSDGLPDWWENWYFASVDACDPSGDNDNDGMHNWQEFVSGTDPTAAGSLLRIDVVSAPPDFQIRWPSVQGRLYSVERSTNAVNYSAIAVDVLATPPVNTYSDSPGASGTYFYRVMVQP
jgi:formylglycine-generating enzyme required for sulfatase activity